MFHMPKLEKIWLMIGVGSLILFLIITGVLGVAMGLHPSDGLTTTIEPEKLKQHHHLMKLVSSKLVRMNMWQRFYLIRLAMIR